MFITLGLIHPGWEQNHLVLFCFVLKNIAVTKLLGNMLLDQTEAKGFELQYNYYSTEYLKSLDLLLAVILHWPAQSVSSSACKKPPAWGWVALWPEPCQTRPAFCLGAEPPPWGNREIHLRIHLLVQLKWMSQSLNTLKPDTSSSTSEQTPLLKLIWQKGHPDHWVTRCRCGCVWDSRSSIRWG